MLDARTKDSEDRNLNGVEFGLGSGRPVKLPLRALLSDGYTCSLYVLSLTYGDMCMSIL